MDGPENESRLGQGFLTRPVRSWIPPGLIFMGTGSLPWVKRRGLALTTYPSLVPRLKECSSTPLLPFRASWPVLSWKLHLPFNPAFAWRYWEKTQRDRTRRDGAATEFRRGIFRIRDRHFTSCVCKMMLIVLARSVTNITQTRVILEKLHWSIWIQTAPSFL